jgi:hypothetical protein
MGGIGNAAPLGDTGATRAAAPHVPHHPQDILKEADPMCYTCGCRRPYDTMDDERNIVEAFFERAGQTEAIGNAGVLAAKQHMLELLQAELERQELEKPQEQY